MSVVLQEKSGLIICCCDHSGQSFDVMVNGKAVSEELKRATCRKTVIKFSFFFLYYFEKVSHL